MKGRVRTACETGCLKASGVNVVVEDVKTVVFIKWGRRLHIAEDSVVDRFFRRLADGVVFPDGQLWRNEEFQLMVCFELWESVVMA